MAVYQFAVKVQVQYLSEQSDIATAQYAFAYTITIINVGSVAAQLISRHWIVTDAQNSIEEVKGLGVVGHQPLLKPGQSFEYTSGVVLNTAQGAMRGNYFCVAEDAARFEVEIPEFILACPHALH